MSDEDTVGALKPKPTKKKRASEMKYGIVNAPVKNESDSYNHDIDDQFILEEDVNRPIEKYVDELDISDQEIDHDAIEYTEKSSTFGSQTKSYRGVDDIPQSLPMNINYGVDPVTNKQRQCSTYRTPFIKDALPDGSIYENMQMISRSIQPEDYRNRVWGTRPDESPSEFQFFGSQSYSRPRVITCNVPATKIQITEEREENTP